MYVGTSLFSQPKRTTERRHDRFGTRIVINLPLVAKYAHISQGGLLVDKKKTSFMTESGYFEGSIVAMSYPI
jgi:hypothetical protein